MSAITVGRNIQPKWRTSAESSRKTKTPARPTGSQQRAPEGAWGPEIQRCDNRGK